MKSLPKKTLTSGIALKPLATKPTAAEVVCDRCRIHLPRVKGGVPAGWVHEAYDGLRTRDLCPWCAAIDAAVYLFEVLSGPATAPLPDFTPETYRTMSCLRGLRCDCVFCEWDRRWKGPMDEWRRSHSLRPAHRSSLPTFDHKLVGYVEGDGYRSSAGSWGRQLGEQSSRGERSRATPHAYRRAEDALTTHRAVIKALLSDDVRCGCTTAQCIVKLRVSVLTSGVDPKTAPPEIVAMLESIADPVSSKIIRRVRQNAMCILAAEDEIREPRGARDKLRTQDLRNSRELDMHGRRATKWERE